MKSLTVIKNALRRKKFKQRGLQITIPNNDLAESHINKANHNLQVMTDLDNLGHTD